MISKHKPGIHEGFLVTRHIDLLECDNVTAASIVEVLGKENSVDTISLKHRGKNSNRKRLNLHYDASLTNIDYIVGIIRAGGGQIASNWLMRRRLSSYRFTDQNAHDNAKHQPACCNKMSPGAGGLYSPNQKN